MENEIKVLLKGFPMATDSVSLGLSTVALLQTKQGPVLVDTGVPQARRQLPERLAESGLQPEDIRYVLMTHLHWDHTGCVDLFPNACFVIGRTEWEYVRSVRDPYYYPMAIEWLNNGRLELIEGERVLLFDGVSAVFVPGHTVGSYAYLVERETETALIAGDAIKNRSELRSGELRLAADPKQGACSIQKLREMSSHILPGHDGWCHLVDGEIIPEGISLNLVFPQGMSANGINSLRLDLDW